MRDKPILKIDELSDYLTSLDVELQLKADIISGFSKSSMALRLTHHVLGLIDWKNLVDDPIRKQFLPLHSEYLPSHPQLKLDSLSEEKSQIYPSLIHRYPNKILFLLSNSCPTYCAFCTRSYMVGPNSPVLKKRYQTPSSSSLSTRCEFLNDYLKSNSNITDVLISGGDIASVEPSIIDKLLDKLADIESLHTIRLATRTLLFDPHLFLPNTSLFQIIEKHSQKLRQRNKELSIQCHFNHANEISLESKNVTRSLSQAGVIIRNQTVLLDGINSNVILQEELIKKLVDSGIYPYYVYQMDMVDNTEHFRTTLATAIKISKGLTGAFTGFQLPRFIVDLPCGGGKRSVYEYDFYDDKYGVYSFKSPLISGDKTYYYCDPLRYLDVHAQEEWNHKKLPY
jgi:lysine 2,3-aminomutase